MTENANILTTPSVTPSRHQVVALAYDGLCTFEFGVAVEIFGLPRPEMGDNWYQFAVAAVDEGPLCATGGIRLMTDGGPELLARADTIVVSAGAASTPRSPRRCAPRWLPPTPADVGLFLSVPGCSFSPPPGCSMAAATTHWRYTAALQSRFPQIRVVEDVLYVGDALLMTSAGSAAGIDLCLHLVREDFGSEAANVVARRTVVSPHRDGGQAQVLRPVARSRESLRLGQLFDYLHQHLAASHTVASLAQRAGMGTRTFCAALRRPPVKRPPAGCWRNDCCAPAST